MRKLRAAPHDTVQVHISLEAYITERDQNPDKPLGRLLASIPFVVTRRNRLIITCDGIYEDDCLEEYEE